MVLHAGACSREVALAKQQRNYISHCMRNLSNKSISHILVCFMWPFRAQRNATAFADHQADLTES